MANPMRFVSQNTLKVAAHVYTLFLHSIIMEVHMAFCCLHVKDVACEYHQLEGLGLNCRTELDCKEPFNCVWPIWVTAHMPEASAWLYKKKKWRSTELVWRIHCTHRNLDGIGKVSASDF